MYKHMLLYAQSYSDMTCAKSRVLVTFYMQFSLEGFVLLEWHCLKLKTSLPHLTCRSNSVGSCVDSSS